MRRLAMHGLVSCLLLLPVAAVADDAMRMTGFLRPRASESVRPPNGDEWSFTISMLAPDGARVNAGDVVARFDGERLKQRLSETGNWAMQEKVKAEGKISELVTAIDQLVKQIAEDQQALDLLETVYAATGGASSEWAISARQRLTDGMDIETKRVKLVVARAKLARKQRLLTVVKEGSARAVAGAEMNLQRFKDQIAMGERKAETSGLVVYKRMTKERQKPRVGSTAQRGTEVMAIVDDRDLYVEAYLREEDWRHLKAGARVNVRILGRRERTVSGSIEKISAIVMKAGDWDRTLASGHPLFERRVFRVEVRLDKTPDEARPDGEVEVTLAREAAAESPRPRPNQAQAG